MERADGECASVQLASSSTQDLLRSLIRCEMKPSTHVSLLVDSDPLRFARCFLLHYALPSQPPYVQVLERRTVRVPGCCYHGTNKSGGGVPQGENGKSEYLILTFLFRLRHALVTSCVPPAEPGLFRIGYVTFTFTSHRREVELAGFREYLHVCA